MCQQKITEIQIKRKLIFFWFTLQYPSDEEIHKMTEFVPCRSRLVADEQETAIRFYNALGFDLALDYPEWRGREKPYYMFFGHDVVWLIDNLIKKWRETGIMWCLKIALCQTRGDKEAKSKWYIFERQRARSAWVGEQFPWSSESLTLYQTALSIES